MVNRTLLSIKLSELADRVGQVRRHRKASVEELKQDRDAAELVSFNLLLAVQACVDIASHCIADEEWPVAKSIGESFTRLEEHGVIPASVAAALRRGTGLRDWIAHGYAGVDLALVHRAATDGLEDLEAFARAMAQWANNSEGGRVPS
jgi:uncharacterized protein YutE (UPF0331/DUF86 family)